MRNNERRRMNRLFLLPLVSLSMLMTSACTKVQNDDRIERYMSPRSCKAEADKLYLTPGNMAYCVGMQDGSFPDIGGHIPNEMGGLWSNPIKLCDGFALSITLDSQRISLGASDEYATYPYGNKFVYRNVCDSLDVERFQFIPDDRKGIIVTYRLENRSESDLTVSVDFSTRFDLRPSWYSEPKGLFDSADFLLEPDDNSIIAAKDRENGWSAVCVSSVESRYSDYRPECLETFGNGCTSTLESEVSIKANSSVELHYAIAGSMEGFNQALNYSYEMLDSRSVLLSDKQEHYRKVISRSYVDIPDEALQDCYTYSKINTDWLVQDFGGLHFLAAGAKEYPWLFGCDNSYALQGVVCSGDDDLAKRTLHSLMEVSERANGNGRIIHEMSPSGAIYNYGNTQETAHYICAVKYVYDWTGDKEWLDSVYPYMKNGIDWLFTTMDTDSDLFPEGYGIMEVKGLDAELIDVAVYSQQALECMSSLALLYDEAENSRRWGEQASELKDKINNLFWDSDRESYCDFYGTSDQAEKVARDAAIQFPQNAQKYYMMADEFAALPEGTAHGFLTNVNWVITVPMETGIAPQEKAIPALDRIRRENCGPYGPYLSSFDKDHAMTISTGIQAVSEAQYGRIDRAVEYLDMIASTLDGQLPGSICEMMPDYGCPAQAWTIYGPAKVIVGYIFGIKPRAGEKEIVIDPSLPSGWDHISITDVKVGECHFNMSIDRDKGATEIHIDCDNPKYKFIIPSDSLEVKNLTGKRHYHETI
ncbi:MAG: amylo-alpha-1,6-glucosidase [Bacteroidales bacterium]|nr:amylo-alpha-1,6-glucosidase [Bacteroidales bacterium]